MADNTVLPLGGAGDTIRTIARTGNSPAKTQVVSLDLGTASDASAESILSASNPLPANWTQLNGVAPGAANPLFVQTGNSGRVYKTFWANSAASGATTVETAITLTFSSNPGTATSTAVSFTPTNGKTFRITGLSLITRGNATATAELTVFSLRVNTGGAVTTSSVIALSTVSGAAATASAFDRFLIFNPEGIIELVGNGTLQWGLTANATFTTNAPTWDALVTGYEF